MKDAEPTRLLPPLPWQDPRVLRLDDTWLLIIFTVVAAILVPWFISGLTIDFAAVSVGLLALGAVHLGFAALSGPSAPNQLRSTRKLAALHALGIIALAFTWHHAGGLQNPLFLSVFALPVIGAIFLSRWQPYLMAILTTVVVALLAANEAPELRWYTPALGALAGWLGASLGKAAISASPPFAGYYAPSEYFVVLLEVFGIMLFACAVAAEYFGVIFDRLDAQVRAARADVVRSQRLWSALLEQLPLPAVLLDANSHEIFGASAPALTRLFAGDVSVIGRDFFQAVHFSYPEPVQRLVNGPDGAEQLSMLRLGDRLLAAEVRVQHLAQRGRRFALVTVHDVTEAHCVKAALDAADHAALVADSDGRLLAFNKPARAVFSGAAVGAEVARLVPHLDPGGRWWDPGLAGRRKLRVDFMRRSYQVTCSAVALPGEDARLYVIAFLPAAQVGTAESTVTTTAVMQGR
jgi:PAS domain-containing protein